MLINKRAAKALIKVMSDGDIAGVMDMSTGEEIYQNPLNFLKYTMEYARINSDDTISIYMKNLDRLWKLAGIYAGVVVIALLI